MCSQAFILWHWMVPLAGLLIVLATGACAQEPPGSPPTTNSTPVNPRLLPPPMRDPERVHDPSTIVTVDGVRRCLCTGPGISVMREGASGKWLREGRLFAEGQFPEWHSQRVPGNRGYLWAPDVTRVGESFFVYYSVSTFGKNTSAIGLAVGSSMDPSSPQWGWEDRGPVIMSRSEDRWIGPGHASIHERDGRQWLVHHYYDRTLAGRPRLRLVPLTWDTEGWPLVVAEK